MSFVSQLWFSRSPAPFRPKTIRASQRKRKKNCSLSSVRTRRQQKKRSTCKQLAIHGSSAAVAELAKLLPDEQLSSWSRIALEAIPGIESDDALRNAAKSLEGRLLIGMINSIGVRRDAKSVQLLTNAIAGQGHRGCVSRCCCIGAHR